MTSRFSNAIVRRAGAVALLVGFQAALLLPAAVVHAQAAGRGSCFTKLGCEQKEVDGDYADSSTDANIMAICGAGKGFCYAKNKPINLTISIGSTTSVVDLGTYVVTVYRYSVSVAGIIAAVIMMIGGFQYLTAGGDAGRVTQGKERIVDALVGLFLTLAAYLILNTINPDLVKLQLPRLPMIKRQEFVRCLATENCFPCGQTYGVLPIPEGSKPPTNPCDPSAVTTDPQKIQQAVAECTGKGCGKACGTSVGFNCREVSAKITAADERCNKDQAAADSSAPKPSFVCWGCTVDGGDCSPSGSNPACCGGFCGQSKCTNGQVGAHCDAKSDCATGICNTSYGNICTSGEVGSPCNSTAECKSGYKCSTSGTFTNVCTPGEKFSSCDSNSQCRTDAGLSCTDNICLPTGTGRDTGCSNDGDCDGKGGKCVHITLGHNFCTDGSSGSPCSTNDECATKICIESRSICGDGSVGSRCDDNLDCKRNENNEPGSPCVSVDWMSGITGAKYCVSGATGSLCKNNTNCVTGLRCVSNRCLPN
ncbi:hypothetical protein HY633_04790 [Candidatus Uhrbacteria bacterium]|nr:hypothetical protein [Candidatus Uhrbacteria bacterium]